MDSLVSDLTFHQTEAVVVLSGIEFPATGVAGDDSFEWPDSLGFYEAGWAGIGEFFFHSPALQWQ